MKFPFASISIVLLFSLIGFSVLGQDESAPFLKEERINEQYSVGYKFHSEEFDGYGDVYLISSVDTLLIEAFGDKLCHISSISPNEEYVFFETLSIGWVYQSETDSILHDRWEGALLEVSSGSVVKTCRDYCGQEWNLHNLWMHQSRIVYDCSGNGLRSDEVVFGTDNESWISYDQNGLVKETGQTGQVFGCGMNFGEQNFYNQEGILLKSIRYENWLPKDATGCHEAVQEKYITEYFPFGALKSRSMFQSSYEGEEYKTGLWQQYEENGKWESILISSKDYELKYVK